MLQVETIDVEHQDWKSKLFQFLDHSFNREEILSKLGNMLSPHVHGIIIEYPYSDKDYRSTYYRFFSKKGIAYSRHCARIHFFEKYFLFNVESTATIISTLPDQVELQKSYLGFMVLRPSLVAPIGRTVLKPKAVCHADGYCMVVNYKVHFFGRNLTVQGFPFMSQDTDISVCAHISAWAILRFFSQMFPDYATRTLADVVDMASPDPQGGLIPSRGLNIFQAERIFSMGGFFPLTYHRAEFGEKFLAYLYSYVESGFPVFAAITGISHAVSIIGHGQRQERPTTMTNGCISSFHMIQSLVINDDNYYPYRTVRSRSDPFTLDDIDGFVVPLPEKIFLSAEHVGAYVENMLKSGSPLDLSFLEGQCPIVRYFVATSYSFKKHLIDNKVTSTYPWLSQIMALTMPKFVWIVEVSNLQAYQQNTCCLRFVLDATANPYEDSPYFLIHDMSHARILNRDTGDYSHIPLPGTLIRMPVYSHNLVDMSL